MTTGRLTWRTQRWSRGSIVEELPRLRARYGPGVAGAVEFARSMLADDLDQPRAQDVRRTLQAIAERGHAAPVDVLDSQTDCELLRQSWRLFGTEYFERLPDEGLQQCAAAALESFERSGGAPSTDGHAVRLVADLLRQWALLEDRERQRIRERARRQGQWGRSAERERAEQLMLSQAKRRMLCFALRAAGIKAGQKNVERLVTEAGKVL